MTIRVPVYAHGELAATALIDDADEALSRHRWTLNGDGYATRWLPFRETGYPRQSQSLHRAVMGLGRGDPQQVDHVNRVRLDCRRSNLRLVQPGEQSHNKTNRNPTGFRGVHVAKSGRFHAKARNRHLGTFDTAEEAAAAARAARQEMLSHAVD